MPTGPSQGQNAHRRVRTDAEREGKYCDGREGRFTQHPQAVAQILGEVRPEIHPSRVPTLFLHLFRTAELRQRGSLRFFLRHPAASFFAA